MSWRKTLLRKSLLYAIIDLEVTPASRIEALAKKMVMAGVDIIQLRAKSVSDKRYLECAVKLRKIIPKKRTLFIINDSPDIAKICDADGVHAGQDDIPVNLAREIIGKDRVVGASTGSLAEALRAQKEGADYIAVGPVYSTLTKPGEKALGVKPVKNISNKIEIPIVAIGGITRSNVNNVLSSGVDIICVTRAISLAGDPFKEAVELKKCI